MANLMNDAIQAHFRSPLIEVIANRWMPVRQNTWLYNRSAPKWLAQVSLSQDLC